MQAAECDPRWYLSIGGGVDVDVGSSDLNQGLAPHYFNNTLTTAYIKSHDWSEVYDNAWRIEGEVGYVLSQHLELFGSFKYAHADAASSATGSRAIFDIVIAPPTIFPLTTEFDDYDAWGGELGFRFFLLSRRARFRPYISLSGGATHVDSIDMAMFVDFSGAGGPPHSEMYRGGFFDDSWIGTASAALGGELGLTCHWFIGANAAIRYQSSLSENDRDFTRGAVDFEGGRFSGRFLRPMNNDAGERWTVPVTGYVKFRF